MTGVQTCALPIYRFPGSTATTEIYTTLDTLSLHDALPIYLRHRHLPQEVAPSSFVTVALWLAATMMLGLMAYSVVLTLLR